MHNDVVFIHNVTEWLDTQTEEELQEVLALTSQPWLKDFITQELELRTFFNDETYMEYLAWEESQRGE